MCNDSFIDGLRNRSEVGIVLETTLTAIIMVQGIIGNALVIAVTCTNNKLHTIANFLILNLAVSDMLMVCIDVPFSLYVLSTGHWSFSPAMCYLVSFTVIWFGVVGLFTLAIISLNRFYYICRFSNYTKIFNVRNVKALISVVWISSALMSVSCLVPYWSDVEFLPNSAVCMPNFRTSSVAFSVFLLVTAVLIPNLIMLISYIRIFVTVHKSKQKVDNFNVLENVNTEQPPGNHLPLPGMSAHGEPLPFRSSSRTDTWISAFTQVLEKRRAHRQKEEMKLTRTLSAVFLVYNICWMPMVTTSLLQVYEKNLARGSLLAATMCMYFSSAINPYIYGIGNRQYREAIQQTCKCRGKKTEHAQAFVTVTEPKGQIVKWWNLIERLRIGRTDSESDVTPDKTTGDQRLEMSLANALRIIARRNVQFVTTSPMAGAQVGVNSARRHHSEDSPDLS